MPDSDTIKRILRLPSSPGRVFFWAFVTTCSVCKTDAHVRDNGQGKTLISCPACGHQEIMSVSPATLLQEALHCQ